MAKLQILKEIVGILKNIEVIYLWIITFNGCYDEMEKHPLNGLNRSKMHHITTKRGRIDKLEDGKYLQNDVVVTFNKLEDAKSLQIFGEQTTSKFNGDSNLFKIISYVLEFASCFNHKKC